MIENVSGCMRDFIANLGREEITSCYEKIPHGKMLRAKLILEIAKNSPEAPKLAVIVELIHMASLLHDDVIDEAQTRRGKASFNAEFGDKNAIMMGDILYSKAFSELTNFSNEIAVCISNAVTKLSIGEIMDVELSKTFNESEEKYFDMLYCKTASLMEAAAKSAAILEGLNGEDFALYCKSLGLAFQIIDDVLDVVSSSKTLGKPALNDFKEGKVTLPYLYLYKLCSNDEKRELKSLHKKELSKEEESWLKEKMKEYGAIELCVQKSKEFGDEARLAIKKYNNANLEKLITQMIERDF